MKVILSLVGLACCLGGLLLLTIGSSLFADGRSQKLAGPGLSVWIVDRWPGPGTPMRLEVEAHGGDRAGIRNVRVLLEGRELVQKEGHGVRWGDTIAGSKRRGAEELEVLVPLPPDVEAGRP